MCVHQIAAVPKSGRSTSVVRRPRQAEQAAEVVDLPPTQGMECIEGVCCGLLLAVKGAMPRTLSLGLTGEVASTS